MSPIIDSKRPAMRRVTNVSFLNSAPYRALARIDWLDYEESAPSECARRLHEEETALGCIPLAEFCQHGGYEYFPYGITADGSVESVFLFSAVPPEQLSTIYVDSASRSSVLLLCVLLQEVYGKSPEQIKFIRIDAEEAMRLTGADRGALVIGDPRFHRSEAFGFKIDLAQEWKKLTGMPFVFAVWAARPGTFSEIERSEILSAFDFADKNREIFAREFAENSGLSKEESARYVRERIGYRIGERELGGIRKFVELAAKAGFLPESSNRLFTAEKPAAEKPKAVGNSDRLNSILLDSISGHRLSIDDALYLVEHASLGDLALAADSVKRVLHPSNRISYIVERNINYTNVCNIYCRFCAFYRAPGKADGYVLTREQIAEKIESMLASGGVQILLQGGLNPELGIEYYEELFKWITSTYPINLHALSADEISHISKVSNLSYAEVFRRLIAAGLGSFPGGGAEILVDKVRRRIARLKTNSAEWLEIHRTAHLAGLRSTCTMMFGVKESWEDRLQHMHKLRQLQDETGGFTAFITWPFQEDNTKLKRGDTSAPEYLRVQAIARLFLDNIENIQSSWVTMGPSVGQVALSFGANDFGSVMFEENVVSAAGTTFRLTNELIERHVREAGFLPFRRSVNFAEVAVNSPSVHV